MVKKTRILLVDDHTIFRVGLRDLLGKYPDVQVVGEVGDGRQAISVVNKLLPDLVVMDLTLPGLNGVQATRQICKAWPDIRVLCLTMHDELASVAEILLAGARGYLLKDTDIHELIVAVRALTRDMYYLSPRALEQVIRDYVARLAASRQSPASDLSDREREVLQLLAEGCPSSAIAEKLFVSIKTVATHREHIMTKLNVHSLAELTKFAIREGVVSVE